MYKPPLGAAAAMFGALLIYLIWPPAPGTQQQAARATVATGQGARTAGSPDRIVQPRAEPGAAHDLSLQESDYTGLSEIPSGRATVHWLEYLKFRRQASSGTRA